MEKQNKIKSKGGRPKLDEEEKLKHRVVTTLTDGDYKRIQELVTRSGKPEADIIRRMIRRKKIKLEYVDPSLFRIEQHMSEALSTMDKAEINLNQAVKKLQTMENDEEVKKNLAELKDITKEFLDSKKQFIKESKQIIALLQEK